MAQPISIAGKECFELDGHPNERICLERRANQSRQTLKQAEASLGNALKNWDTEPEFKFKASQRLIKSVDAFHQYQKSQC